MAGYVLAKVLAALALPGNWPIYALAAIVLALRRGHVVPARRIAMGLLAGWVVIGALPVKEILLFPLEQAYRVPPWPAQVDGIVLLGGAEQPAATLLHGSGHVNDAGDRLLATLALARRYPQARIVVSGTSDALQGGDRPPPAILARILTDAGLDPARLVIEPRARNTRENAVFSRAVAAPRPGERWLLVTSAFHMPRAMREFAAAGWPEVTPFPTDYRTTGPAGGFGWAPVANLAAISLAAKEYLGLIAAR